MIGFLRGRAAVIASNYCMLDVGGVGYRVFVSDVTRKGLQINEEAFIYTHMSVREDAIQLYGFSSQEEYDIFQLLIAVSGIGPKVAMGILSAITVKEFCKAVRSGQVKTLTKLPGIGKKSAERLILELKDKINADNYTGSGDEDLPVPDDLDGANDELSEAVEALKNLGYTNAEIMPVFKRAEKGLGIEALIKFALRELARRN